MLAFVLRLHLGRLMLTGLLAGGLSAVAQPLYEYKPLKHDRRVRTAPPLSPAEARPMVGTPKLATDTQISVDIFTGKEGVGYQAREWEPVFERAGVSVRIRPGISTDKISIRDKQYGKLREVYVTGKLERNGGLSFPGHSFAAGDAAALEEWLRELKTYGAAGNPAGQPVWGLSKTQFEDVFHALSAPVAQEASELSFDEAIRALHLPDRFPFRISAGAEKLEAGDLRRHSPRVELAGFSQGTALAMLLSQYGLAFRPNRTPSGGIELLAVAADEGEAAWPIGWEAPEGTYPASIAPKLFVQTTVELKNQKLIDVLGAIGEKTSTPVRIDFATVAAIQADLQTVISVAHRRMTWSQLLLSVTNPSFLTAKIRNDEAKKPFVWVTTLPHQARLRPMRPRRPLDKRGSDERGADPETP